MAYLRPAIPLEQALSNQAYDAPQESVAESIFFGREENFMRMVNCAILKQRRYILSISETFCFTHD